MNARMSACAASKSSERRIRRSWRRWNEQTLTRLLTWAVMESSESITTPRYLTCEASRCARELILFLFPWFFMSLSSKMLLISHLCDDLTSWRHVLTSQKLLHLSHVMDWLERWSCLWFHGFSGCSLRKCYWSCIFGMISCHNVTSWRHVNT